MSNNQKFSINEYIEFIKLYDRTMDDFLYVYDLKNDFYFISPSALDRFNFETNEFHNVVSMHENFVYEPDLEMLQNDLDKMLNGEKDFHDLLYRWLDKNKSPVWINCRGEIIKDENNKPIYMIGCINEIGNKPKADNISGLLGERSADTFMREVLPRIDKGYIMLIGIDGFRDINERLGRDYGDLIIRKTADMIQNCLAPTQFLYHLFADEFLVVDLFSDNPSSLLQAYKRMRVKIDYFLIDNGYEVMYTISAGLISYEDLNGNTAYNHARQLLEFSLLQAKKNGRNQCYNFNQKDYEAAVRKASIQDELLHAVLADFEGFDLYLQPLISSSSHSLYGAEALLRYDSSDYGRISPAEFVPILEESALIIPVGKWIIDEACKRLKKIREVIPDFKISINLSYIQILRSDVIHQLEIAVKQFAIPEGSIIVEVTESGLLETDARLSKFSEKLREHGIWLALDDFGTGYSNFHYLSELRPDIIKFDRTFIAKAIEDDYEYELLKLVSEMIHNLDLKICAEGIESQNDEDKIMSIKPDYSQGYYYGKPCTYEEFLTKYINK